MKYKKIKVYLGFIVILTIYSVFLIGLITLLFKIEGDLYNAIIGFIGAIIGGTISGILTLLGVKMTLDYYKEDKFNEEFRRKSYFLDTSIKILKKEFINVHLLDNIEYQLELYENKTDILQEIVENFRKDFVSNTILDLYLTIYKTVNIQKKTILINDHSRKELADKQREYALLILERLEQEKINLENKKDLLKHS
jgi:hypothetical protein